MTPPELGRNPAVTGNTEIGLELTEKALGEQLWKSEEVHEKLGITNAHQGSDVSYSSATVFYSINFGQREVSVGKHAYRLGRKKSKSNRQTKPTM